MKNTFNRATISHWDVVWKKKKTSLLWISSTVFFSITGCRRSASLWAAATRGDVLVWHCSAQPVVRAKCHRSAGLMLAPRCLPGGLMEIQPKLWRHFCFPDCSSPTYNTVPIHNWTQLGIGILNGERARAILKAKALNCPPACDSKTVDKNTLVEYLDLDIQWRLSTPPEHGGHLAVPELWNTIEGILNLSAVCSFLSHICVLPCVFSLCVCVYPPLVNYCKYMNE